MPLLELPREHISVLSYERFLREYALPRQPLIIEGVGAEWPASSAWCDLSYFLSHAGVDLEHEVAVHEGGAGADELECSVGEALRRLQQREESNGGGGGGQPPLYLSAWEYVRGGSEALQADFSVPPLFDRSPTWLAENAVLGCAAVDMKWLYLGQAGTGSATHVDTNMTSAWLWVARGEKEWVCAHGGDYAALLATAEQGEGDDEYKARFPDLFAALDPGGKPHPALATVRLFHGFQRAGEVCFNPSRSVHAVRNTCLTISLTHNYVDASNLPDVLGDAVRSLTEELLPMAAALGPKKVLKLLARSLHIKQAALRGVLRALPTLFAPTALEQVLQAACAPEGANTEAAAAVEALLRPPLELMGQPNGVLPQLVDAATRLVVALELGSNRVAGTAKGASEEGRIK